MLSYLLSLPFVYLVILGFRFWKEQPDGFFKSQDNKYDLASIAIATAALCIGNFLVGIVLCLLVYAFMDYAKKDLIKYF